MNIKNEDMYVMNNNSGSLTFQLETDTGEAFFETGDKIYVTVKRSATDIIPVISKIVTAFIDGQIIVNFTLAEISAIPVGTYVYDVVWVTPYGDVLSIFPSAKYGDILPKFIVRQGVTDFGQQNN